MLSSTVDLVSNRINLYLARSHMKTVGKQLQEARLAKEWTPELAARETKIKVERLLDLEKDDYSNFSGPTYARGFVRTYARSLGLDEYKILRQLDNKLPDDDSANIVTENGGVAYLPETSMPARVAHRDHTGLYIVMALGGVVALVIALVLFEAYRVGELPRWLGNGPETASSSDGNGTNSNPEPVTPPNAVSSRALPVDSNTPPPLDAATTTNPPEGQPGSPPRALPVDLNTPAPAVVDNPPSSSPSPAEPPRALPVDLNDLNSTPPSTMVASATQTKIPPRALPVDPSELTGEPPPPIKTNEAITPAVPPSNAPEMVPSMPAVSPAPAATADDGKPLVLTASQDSYVKVTNLDSGDNNQPLYASVLKSGHSVAFNGHKFSINVGIPSAVEIKLDGVNYGPHSDGESPETFTVQSHLQ